MGQYHLAEEIIKRSAAKNWNDARREWALETVYFATEPDQCMCGKFPIIELCVLRTRKNSREAIVGNECVKKFLGLPSDRIFNGLRRIQVDAEKAMNEEAIRYAHSRGWMNDWELGFYLDTWRKRKLSSARAEIRAQINDKVMRMVRREARPAQTKAEHEG